MCSCFIWFTIGIWGIIKLFIEDKDQDRKLSSLETLANSQNDIVLKMAEQIQELSRQTSEYQYQTELMRESNILVQKQIELQTDTLIHNKLTDEKKIEIEKVKRMAEIKPHFILDGGSSNPSHITVNLINKGQIAKNVIIQNVNNDFTIFSEIDIKKEFDTNQKLELNGYANSSKTYYNSNQVPFSIEIFYNDADGNKYKQRVNRENQKYKVLAPELVKSQV